MKLKLIVALSLLFTLFGCSKNDTETVADAEGQTTMSQLDGQVFYLERKMLPPGAVLTVSLEDVSKMDVASTQIAATEQELVGGPPFLFSLNYDAAQIQDAMRYSLRATVSLNDTLLMTTTEAFDPFNDNIEPIELKLSVVARTHTTTTSHEAHQHSVETGLAVVSVDPLAPLSNTYWKLLSIQEQVVSMEPGQEREVFFQLQEDALRLKGFAGCNELMGSYLANGNELEFSQIGATRKACQVGMQTESQFIEVLTSTRHFSIHEHTLTLFNEAKRPIARFEAQYFN